MVIHSRWLLVSAHLCVGIGCTERVEVLTSPDPVVVVPPPDAGPAMDSGTTLPAVSLPTQMQVSAGNDHSCATVDGAAYCWGNNNRGQLGTGDAQARTRATRVDDATDWAMVRAAASHSCALKTDGTVHCWGDNSSGQLGVGDTRARPSPEPVATALRFVAIDAKWNYTCGITTNDTLWCWGDNVEGTLGQDDGFPGENALLPVQVGTDGDWANVSTGQGHNCGLRRDGSAWCWGRNTAFQLGVGEGTPQQLRSPQLVTGGGTWSALRSGQQNTCALDPSGRMWCTGTNTFFALAQLPAENHVMTLVVDEPHVDLCIDTFSSCAIRQGGNMYCSGRGIEGQLGTGDIDERTTPTFVGSGFEQVACGRFHTCAVRDSTVVCTGGNDFGEIGQGDTERRRTFSPVVFAP